MQDGCLFTQVVASGLLVHTRTQLNKKSFSMVIASSFAYVTTMPQERRGGGVITISHGNTHATGDCEMNSGNTTPRVLHVAISID